MSDKKRLFTQIHAHTLYVDHLYIGRTDIYEWFVVTTDIHILHILVENYIAKAEYVNVYLCDVCTHTHTHWAGIMFNK